MKFTKQQYRSVKSLNKTDLAAFLEHVWQSGYQQGVDVMATNMSDAIIKGLKETPGIGKKRYENVLMNINGHIQLKLRTAENNKEENNDERWTD